MTNFKEQTLASIVTEYHQTVPVFEKYDLDFCCKGKRTLAEACSEKGLQVDTIMAELENNSVKNDSGDKSFNDMNAEELISYILLHHHFYLKQTMPIIADHLTKVVTKHGERFPYMVAVLDHFLELKNDMTLHMQKEELILFPRIKEVSSFFHYKQKKNISLSYVFGPVEVMEKEHEIAGTLVHSIRQLTEQYSIPIGACTTFKVVLAELKEFEEDLHRHVHLENNLLFPMAEKMMGEISFT